MDDMEKPTCILGGIGGAPKQITMAERFCAQRQKAEEHLADIKRAQEILAENPQMMELLSIIQRIGGIHI